MAPKVLVVDRNEAFAAVLRDMLETDGGYQVEVAQTGSDALAILIQADFDLTIVDMDLDPEDMSYRDLIRSVRQVQPTTRLMLIPLMGEDLPPEAGELGLQGALSKPFFADDLLPGIQDALAKKVPPPSLQQMAPFPPPRSVGLAHSDVQTVLAELARETNADTILLVSRTSGGQDVIAHFSALDKAGASTLAGLVLETVSAAQATAQFLGQPHRPFEHSMFEGQSLRLYVLSLSQGMMLVVVTPTSTPLGTIRYNLRRAGRALAGLSLT
jgi:CheY-like chemotaxis protein/predicted regulator of Ras-like GTPase activity (Roadblock/LC7/MglB family)